MHPLTHLTGITKRSLDGSTSSANLAAHMAPLTRESSFSLLGGASGGATPPPKDVPVPMAERGPLSRSGRRHHSISIMNTSQKVPDTLPSTKRHGSGTFVATIEAFNTAIESSSQNQHLTEDSGENSDDDDEDHDTLDIYGTTHCTNNTPFLN